VDSLARVVGTRATPPIAAAAASAAGAAIVWLTAYHVSAVAAIDQRTLDGFKGLWRPDVARQAARLSQLVDPGPFAVLATMVLLVALVRRRPRTALAVVGILLGANVTTQVLKPALGKPQLVPWIETATWPSGHATAAMSLALCSVLVVPRWLRPAAAALGGVAVLAIVYAILLLGHHEPSDILGGLLVAATWASLGIAALHAANVRSFEGDDRDRPLPIVAALRPIGLAAIALAAAAGALVLLRLDFALDYATGHTTFVVGVIVIAVGAMGLSAAASLGLTRG
jgi:membrane-associated phospholipid phosphatase